MHLLLKEIHLERMTTDETPGLNRWLLCISAVNISSANDTILLAKRSNNLKLLWEEEMQKSAKAGLQRNIKEIFISFQY